MPLWLIGDSTANLDSPLSELAWDQWSPVAILPWDWARGFIWHLSDCPISVPLDRDGPDGRESSEGQRVP